MRHLRAFDRSTGSLGGSLQNSEDVGEVILRNMNTAVLVVNANGCVARCNDPAAAILGLAAEAVVGAEAGRWFVDAQGRGVVERTLAEGVRFKGAEAVVERADGAAVPVGISCAPIIGADGRVSGAVATFQDLSEMRQLQQQVLQTEKMASIGQLAAGVAHEINNPMGFIHANLFQLAEYVGDLRRVWGEVDQLQKVASQAAAPEVREAAERVAALSQEVDVEFLLSDLTKAIRESQEGSERIRHIVQDLRDFSHQDNGELTLADVNLCLDSTANIVWPMMKHMVQLEKNYADLPAVTCFPMQLKQVFMNLLVNAFQAIESKHGENAEIGSIVLSTEHRGGEVVIAVTDTGVGIAPSDLDRIFDPFFTTKKVGAGTGLGLSTSYNLIQRHGGRIEADSRQGEGATFRVVLPVEGMPDGD